MYNEITNSMLILDSLIVEFMQSYTKKPKASRNPTLQWLLLETCQSS